MAAFELQIADVRSVARYFLQLADPEIGDILSNLKLQKLLYYAQGVHLGFFKKELFAAEIHAWAFGPVVEQVYHEYKNFGSNAIFIPDGPENLAISRKQKQLLNRVFAEYGQYSGWKLSAMTHAEGPWRLTPPKSVISKQILMDFFGSQPVVVAMLSETPAESRQKAAAFLLADYENNADLTAFSSIDSDDFYEMP